MGALLAAGIIAVGKVGAVIAATLMHSYWQPPTNVDIDSEGKILTDKQRFDQQTAPFRYGSCTQATSYVRIYHSFIFILCSCMQAVVYLCLN